VEDAHRHRHRGSRGGHASQDNGGAEAGRFDFYVMSLSWSPGFCATAAGQNDPLQCGPEHHFAFVLHGLWPQYQRGGWPQNCSTEAADESLVNSMLTIMPSPKLVAHEWEKHGTCSGLSPKDYFEEASEAFNSVKIPSQYKAPQQRITVSPDQLQHDFAADNPKIGDQGLVVLCSGNGRYLQEVRVCLTEDLEGRRCNGEVLRDACKSNQIVMRPMR
jgi:ribonuclease T2